MIIPFILAGSGMALVFAPSASAILNSVRVDQAGQASGATNAIRELGGTFGIAVLATVFSGAGAYTTPQAFVDGLVPALWVGVAVLAFGALVAAVLPFGGKATASEVEEYASGARSGRPRRASRRDPGGELAAGRSEPRTDELGSTEWRRRPRPSLAGASRQPSAGTR